MTVRASADIHFDEGDVSHRWHPADDNCDAYGVLKFKFLANLYFGAPGQIDEVIAELVALRAEMTGGDDDEYRLTAKGEEVADAFCPDAYAAPGVEYYCTLKAGHKGLHAQLTSTGAFIAEWGYEDGRVHTTSGHYPAHPQGNLYPDGTPWCAQCGTHHRVPATPAQDEHPAQVAS